MDEWLRKYNQSLEREIGAYKDTISAYKSLSAERQRRIDFADKLHAHQERVYGSWWRDLLWGGMLHRIVHDYLGVFDPELLQDDQGYEEISED